MPNTNTIVYTNNKHYQDIADAIREKNGTENTYTPAQMAQAILALEAGEGSAVNNQNKTVIPTEERQYITADSGYTGLDRVTVEPINSDYVGSGITRKTTSDLSAAGATVTVPAGYYSAQATKSVVVGTTGTPTATKSAVNNNSIIITPSVTNDTGYITGGTINGTSVTVTASEVVSGTKSITENGTNIDVTNYATVNVNIPTVNISQDANGYIVMDNSGNYTPPGEWTTDGIAERTEPNGAITINLATGKTIGRNAFYQTPITELTITNSPYFGYQAFFECKSLTTIHAPNLVGIRGNQYGTQTGVFNGCTALQGVVFPSHGNHVLDSYNFQNCTALTYADFKDMSRLGGADVFSNTGLNVLIIRKTDGVTTLQGINNFNNSPFASNGTGGTLYVPSALVSSYQSAAQWSTLLGYANNSIKAIEGSYYETHYADGTLINA